MTTELTTRLYERSHAAGLVGDTIRPGGLALTDRMVELAGLVPGDRVVDIGCGPGASLEHLRAAHGLSVVGLDRSDVLLAAARERTPAPLVRCDGGRLPLADATADAVLAECSLSLMRDMDASLREIRRVLRPGGTFMCSDVFAREPAGAAALRSLPFDSCIRGAIGAEELHATLERNRFFVDVWEDHTPALRSFAAQLVWRGGSMRNFWCQAGGVGDPGVVEAAMAMARPGYYLMIARRGEGGRW